MKIRICAALLALMLAATVLSGCELQAAPTEPTEKRSLLQIDVTAPAPAIAHVQIGAEQNSFTAFAQLTEEEAIAIALTHAGLTKDQVTGLTAKLDTDDGVKEYEIEFRFEAFEYDYEIHAETGEVLKAEKELDQD